MSKFDPYKARIAVDRLTFLRVWPKGFYGYFKRARYLLKVVMKSNVIEHVMSLCVFANTVVLAIDHYFHHSSF